MDSSQIQYNGLHNLHKILLCLLFHRPPPRAGRTRNAPFSERTVTPNPAENCATHRRDPDHYALIKNTLTIYGLVYPRRLSKKKSTGEIGFLQKYSVQEIENESIPLFWGSDATKKSNRCFRGIKFRQNEIKPLYYIVITNGVLDSYFNS